MIPENILEINTNLSQKKLIEIINAINNKQVTFKKSSLYNASRLCEFSWKNLNYRLDEWFETVTDINSI